MHYKILAFGFFIFLLGSNRQNTDCGPLFSSIAKDEVCKNCELKIPKIIHHVWHSWKPGEKNPPPYFQDLADTLKKNQPDWQYEFWDDARSREFIVKKYPDFLKTYDGYNNLAKRHDALRYFIMDYYGGVYIDMGFLSIKDIGPLLAGKELVFSEQSSGCHSIASGFLASVPRHPFWKFLTSQLEARKDMGVVYATGPVFLTEMILAYDKANIGVNVLPSKYMFPFGWYGKENENAKSCINDHKKCETIYPEAYLVNFWKGSWLKL